MLEIRLKLNFLETIGWVNSRTVPHNNASCMGNLLGVH
jgi:hypothetical protein